MLALALASIAVVACAFPLAAQDRWKLLDLGLDSGFETELEWPRPGATLWWRNGDVGYYRTFTENGDNKLVNYKTTDGGKTWFIEEEPLDPVPHTILDDSFGYSPDGYITEDGGETWEKVMADYSDTADFPDEELRYTVTGLVATSRENLVVFYQLHDWDEQQKDSVPFGPYRMAFTQDGGSAWTYVDSMTVFGDVLQILYDSTSFGFLQTPEEMTTRTSIGWWKLLNMPNDSIVVVGTKAFGIVDGNLENHYYLGKLNLNTFDALWFRLPFFEGLNPPPAAPLDFRFVNKDMAYALQTEFISISDPNNLKHTLWLTDNCGETWRKADVPPWVDYESMLYLSASHVVASNGYSNDSGVTWTAWAHPFGTNIEFYATDSTHYHLANRYSLFAQSTDAGRTWSHNEAGGIPHTVVGSQGTVLVGREYQSLLISRDTGDTWRDVGAEGLLPDRLSIVHALGFPNANEDLDRIVGVGSFVEYDGTFKAAVIETTDGGDTWSVGQELPQLIGATGPVRMYFVGDPESEIDDPAGFLASSKGLFVSTNGGISWTRRDSTHRFEHLAMSNPQFGSAIMPDGIYTTDDGGMTWTQTKGRTDEQNTALGLTEFGFNDQRATFSNRTGGYRNWTMELSTDGGDSWTQGRSGSGQRNMDVGAFWGDSAHVHVVGRAGVIQHSKNGEAFVVVNDSVSTFTALAGMVAAGQDDDYIYVIAPGNRAGRFEMFHMIPVGVPITPGGPVSDLGLNPNPAHGSNAVLVVSLSEAADVNVKVYDMLGKPVSTTTLGRLGAGSHRTGLDIDGLPSGHYRVEVSTPDGMLQAPLIIAR